MKKMINKTHVSGLLYENDLQIRVTGPNSKKPGTTFIMGNVSILTDPEEQQQMLCQCIFHM